MTFGIRKDARLDLTLTILGALIMLPILLGVWAGVALVRPVVLRVRDRFGGSRTANDGNREEEL